MDPPSLVAKATVTEMWPFPLAASGPGGILGVHHHHHPVGPARMPDHGPGFLAELGDGHHRGDASVEESTVTEQSGGGVLSRRKRRDLAAVSEDESSKLVSTCSGNEQTDCEVKRLKVMGSRDNIVDSKVEVEASSGICNKPTDQNAQPVEPPKQDYIHVRARRGQATDNHSLAERARREKISERMKVLQDLVPGCNKVIGKALVLDEIINYIQSLQRQVEFLSMKLEAVNSRMNSDTEGFPAKDATREFGQRSPQEWLHMQIGGGFERAT